jgi:hypothetical protein
MNTEEAMRKHYAAVFVIAMVPVMATAQQFLTTPPGAPVDPNTRFDVVAIKPIEDASSSMMIRMTPGGRRRPAFPPHCRNNSD